MLPFFKEFGFFLDFVSGDHIYTKCKHMLEEYIIDMIKIEKMIKIVNVIKRGVKIYYIMI